MTKYAIEFASLDDTMAIADGMRKPDEEEVWAAAHMTPVQAVLHSCSGCKPKVGLADGRPVCLFGVSSNTALSFTGTPWMLATDELELHQKPFIRRCRPVMAEMKEEFDLLRNWVDARNTIAIRWLEWLGFEVHEPQPFGVEGLPFHLFEMRS